MLESMNKLEKKNSNRMMQVVCSHYLILFVVCVCNYNQNKKNTEIQVSYTLEEYLIYSVNEILEIFFLFD